MVSGAGEFGVAGITTLITIISTIAITIFTASIIITIILAIITSIITIILTTTTTIIITIIAIIDTTFLFTIITIVITIIAIIITTLYYYCYNFATGHTILPTRHQLGSSSSSSSRLVLTSLTRAIPAIVSKGASFPRWYGIGAAHAPTRASRGSVQQ